MPENERLAVAEEKINSLTRMVIALKEDNEEIKSKMTRQGALVTGAMAAGSIFLWMLSDTASSVFQKITGGK